MLDQSRQDKGARFLLLAASLVIVISGLKLAASLLIPLLIAVFLALINLPLLNWLRGRKVPTFAAVLITVITSLTVFVSIVWLIGGSVATFGDRVPEYNARLQLKLIELLTWLEAQGLPTDQIDTEFVDTGGAWEVMVGTLRRVAGAASNFVVVLLTIVFTLFEAAGFPDKLQAAFGHRSSSERYEKIRREIQRYVGVKTVVSLFTGIFVAIPLWAMKIEFALLWGLIAFLLNYIPNLGSFIASIPPVLLTLVEKGFGWALAVAAVFITVNTVFGNFVEPYLMGRRLGLSTLVVFLSLVFWGWVWGPIGMLLSVPLTMIVKIMLENTEDLRWIAVLLSGAQPAEATGTPRPIPAEYRAGAEQP